MKRRLLSVVSALALTAALAVPVHAATEYGAYYDESNLLYSDELAYLGAETLPSFLDTYDIDLRVDVLTSLGELSNVEEAAEYLYTEYGYGGFDSCGASLTLLVHADEDGVALDEWCVYFGGDDEMWTTHAPFNIPDVYDIMTEENWAGDLDQDIRTLTDAVNAMMNGVESFLDAGGMHHTGMDDPGPEEPVSEPENVIVELDNVTDAAGLLQSEEWQDLESRARDLSWQHDIGVYIITVEDYTDYTDGSIYDAADLFYHDYALGLGENLDAVMLILSMESRDYLLIAYGENAQYAFNDEGRERLDDFFLDEFGNDDWYGGFSEYLTWTADYLENAANGTPYSADHIPMNDGSRVLGIIIRVAVMILIPLAAAAIYSASLVSKMKSVAVAGKAVEYMSGDLQLTGSDDVYIRTTESRREIEKDKSSSSNSSGGGSGTSGKF